jgi:protein-S-isoprenylcysteine O-methyltransferase Ste14
MTEPPAVANGFLARAVLAFIFLPGIVAFLVPLLLLAPGGPGSFVNLLGGIPLGLGIIVLMWCVREFYVAGRGTLAPWAPPQELVVSGLYRVSRNPMYVGVLLILWGWAIGFRSWPLAAYAVVVMLAFHLRVVLHEEPWLARTHGEKWMSYKTQVPRWLGVGLRFGRSSGWGAG